MAKRFFTNIVNVFHKSKQVIVSENKLLTKQEGKYNKQKRIVVVIKFGNVKYLES